MNDKNQANQDIEEASKDKNSFNAWVKAHKKQLIIVGISIPTFIAFVLGIKNKVF